MKFKNVLDLAVDNMLLNKKKTLAVIAVITMSFLLLGDLIAQTLFFNRDEIHFKEVLGKDIKQIYVIKDANPEQTLQYGRSDVERFRAQISSCVGVEQAGWLCYVPQAVKEVNGSASAERKGYWDIYWTNDFSYLSMARIAYDQEIETAPEGYTPVLAGASFRDILKAGDTFRVGKQTGDKICYVVGFLEEGAESYPVSSFVYASGFSTQSFDQALIAIATTEDVQEISSGDLTSIYWKPHGREDVEEVKNNVQRKAKECGLTVYSFSLEEISQTIRLSYHRENEQLLFLTGFFLLIATLTIVSTMTISLFLRQKDIGVLYSNGATFTDLARSVFLEAVIILLAAVLLFIVLFYKAIAGQVEEYVRAVYSEQFKYVLMLIGVFAGLMALIGSALPIIFLRRRTVVSLLGFRE